MVKSILKKMSLTKQQTDKLIKRREILLGRILKGELLFRLSHKESKKYFDFNDWIFRRPAFHVVILNHDKTKAYVNLVLDDLLIQQWIPTYEIKPSSPIFWITWYEFINLFKLKR